MAPMTPLTANSNMAMPVHQATHRHRCIIVSAQQANTCAGCRVATGLCTDMQECGSGTSTYMLTCRLEGIRQAQLDAVTRPPQEAEACKSRGLWATRQTCWDGLAKSDARSTTDASPDWGRHRLVLVRMRSASAVLISSPLSRMKTLRHAATTSCACSQPLAAMQQPCESNCVRPSKHTRTTHAPTLIDPSCHLQMPCCSGHSHQTHCTSAQQHNLVKGDRRYASALGPHKPMGRGNSKTHTQKQSVPARTSTPNGGAAAHVTSGSLRNHRLTTDRSSPPHRF